MAATRFNWRAARRIAERSGSKTTALALRCGCSQGHMSNVLTGTRPPSWELVMKLASALGVDVMDLLGTEKDFAVAAPGERVAS